MTLQRGAGKCRPFFVAGANVTSFAERSAAAPVPVGDGRPDRRLPDALRVLREVRGLIADPMKTLPLDLDSLRVESFGTGAAEVQMAEVPPTYDRSCILSCPLACG